MSNPDQNSLQAAVRAYDALRLFVFNAVIPETEYTSSSAGDGASYQEIIQYRTPSSWGDITRDKKSLSITVIPNLVKAPDFAARRLVFNVEDDGLSKIFKPSSEEFQAGGGRAYTHELARTIQAFHQSSRLTPFNFEGQRLLAIANTPRGMEAGVNAWQLGREIARHLGPDHCILRYPFLDIPHAIELKNLPDQPDHPVHRTLKRFRQMAEQLPSVLQLERLNDEYPATYAVTPLTFSIGMDDDPIRAKALSIGAEARAGAMNNEYPDLPAGQ